MDDEKFFRKEYQPQSDSFSETHKEPLEEPSEKVYMERRTNRRYQPSPRPNSTDSSKKTIAFVVIVILLLAIIGLLIYLIISPNNKPANNTVSNGTTQEEESELDPPSEEEPANSNDEVEIADTYVLNALNDKLKVLSGATKSNAKVDEIISINYYTPFYNLFSNTLAEKEKFAITLLSLEDEGKFNNVDSVNLTDTEILRFLYKVNPDYYSDKTALDPNVRPYSYVINGNTVAEKYQEIFGEELVKKDELELPICRLSVYDSTRDIYFIPPAGCGGVIAYYSQLYKEKFTKNDNFGKAYAYVWVGTLAYDLDTNFEQCAVHSDITSYQNIRGKILEEYSNCPYNANTIFINSSNYQNFTPYRFVFEKNADGTYHFSKVEKL